MTRPRTLAALLAAVTIALAGCSSSGPAASPVTITTPTAFSALAPSVAQDYIDARIGESDFVVLDVRTAEETSAGIIEGATTGFDFYSSAFVDQLSGLDRDAEYLVYCRSGNRSSQTLEFMRELGFTRVTHLYGGIAAWAEAGLPIAGN